MEYKTSKPIILTCVDYYLPGFKAGGPLRTISNMVAQIGEVIDFRIITRDRDATDAQPYPNVNVDAWNQVGQARVYYASPGHLSFRTLRALVKTTAPDALYMNSFFSTLTIKCLALRRIGALPDIPVVVAPRGEFSPGALALKQKKKSLYIALAKALGLYNNVLWQASSPVEQGDIRAVFGDRAQIHVAPNVPAAVRQQAVEPRAKSPGEARFIFLSRISPKKNLHRLIEMLGALSGTITLSIVGPVRDEAHWQVCQQMINRLPAHVQVEVLGSVPHEQVHVLLAGHHFFVLPTLGENFGHAILEALAAGVPVLISDQTPWRDLAQAGVGWDIFIEDAPQWRNVLQQCVDMSQTEYDRMSNNARAYAVEWTADNSILQANRELFAKAIAK
ncbi:MAG: glycosyltransferase [Anaerolineae bacterium]|nr:glycosyltransferase [Anaerolineae bacterium]